MCTLKVYTDASVRQNVVGVGAIYYTNSMYMGSISAKIDNYNTNSTFAEHIAILLAVSRIKEEIDFESFGVTRVNIYLDNKSVATEVYKFSKNLRLQLKDVLKVPVYLYFIKGHSKELNSNWVSHRLSQFQVGV